MPTDDTRTPDRPPKPPARRCIVSVDGVRCPEPPRYPGRDESSFCSTHDDPDNAETKAWQQAIARREPDWRTMPTDDTPTPDPLTQAIARALFAARCAGIEDEQERERYRWAGNFREAYAGVDEFRASLAEFGYGLAARPSTSEPSSRKAKRIDWSNVVVDEGDEAP